MDVHKLLISTCEPQYWPICQYTYIRWTNSCITWDCLRCLRREAPLFALHSVIWWILNFGQSARVFSAQILQGLKILKSNPLRSRALSRVRRIFRKSSEGWQTYPGFGKPCLAQRRSSVGECHGRPTWSLCVQRMSRVTLVTSERSPLHGRVLSCGGGQVKVSSEILHPRILTWNQKKRRLQL